MILDQDCKKRKTCKILWQVFLLGCFCIFKNLNRKIDLVVKTNVTPFLINSHNIWHLIRKSSSGVKYSL